MTGMTLGNETPGDLCGLDLQLRCQENCIICLTDYDDSSQARILGEQKHAILGARGGIL